MANRKLTQLLALAAIATLVAAGCSDSDDTNDAGTDSGVVDTGVRPDTGVLPDTGVADTGTTPDAGDAGTNPDASEVTLESVAIEPATFDLQVGTTLTLIVRGTYSDATTAVITMGLAFESSAPLIASVDAAGVVSGLEPGMATISVTVGGKSANATVTVTAEPVLTFPDVFADDYASGVTFMDFGGATNLVTIDTAEAHSGTASLRIEVPAAGYTGGAFKAGAPVDGSSYDAVTFWAKASAPKALNVAGIGNDANSSVYQAEWNAIALTTTWTKYIIPVPNPAMFTGQYGLFHFAEGSDEGAYTIWIDELRYEALGAGVLGVPQPAIATESVTRGVGDTYSINGSSATYVIGGAPQTLGLARPWMTWFSSNESAVTVDASGVATAVAPGTAIITASLGGVAATGATTITVTSGNVPSAAAPTPTADPANVISIFSNAYTNRTVDTWSAPWDSADLTDVQVAGDDVKRYSNLVFAGVEFTSATIDATSMTRFHMDIWTPDATTFGVKLVDFGADGAYAGGDDREHQLDFTAGTTPAIVNGQWISIDVPLSDFVNLTTRGHLAQMIIVANNSATVYVDNVYLYDAGSGPTAPSTAAPTPSTAASDVISFFSNAYTNVTVDTWSAVWDVADLADAQVAGDDVKVYSNLVFAGIELTSATVDATSMTRFHMDIWTPNASTFGVKLVDFGADGVYAGGDDREHQLDFTASTTPAIVAGQWISIDVPLSDFVNLTTRGHIAQIILVANNNATVYVDNMYLYRQAPSTPGSAAPTPTHPSGDVISLFSNAYTNVTVDTWSAGWDVADLTDVQIAGDDTKQYANLVFAGIEFTSATIDATAMTHFHIDVWTSSATTFGVKLVDFGANGVYMGGDDSEHQIDLTSSTSPALVQGQWVSLDLPLASFTNLAARGHLAQLIIVANNNATVWVDNVYLHR
ncbi:Ig-like domain-containing protein [Myxococcota bacterium]|nr:Ig-like domain-containing protein [Myxococcota bacterium]